MILAGGMLPAWRLDECCRKTWEPWVFSRVWPWKCRYDGFWGKVLLVYDWQVAQISKIPHFFYYLSPEVFFVNFSNSCFLNLTKQKKHFGVSKPERTLWLVLRSGLFLCVRLTAPERACSRNTFAVHCGGNWMQKCKIISFLSYLFVSPIGGDNFFLLPATFVQVLKNMPSAHSICPPLRKQINRPGSEPDQQ